MGILEGAVIAGKFVFNELMSNSINDVTTISKEWIKKAVHDEHDQSYSTKIYRIIENTLNIITNNKYKDLDILYEAVEKIFIEFHKRKDEVKAVKTGLSLLIRDVSDSRCEDFLEKFYDAVCQDEELNNKMSVRIKKKEFKIFENGFQQVSEKVDNNYAEIKRKLDILVDKKDPFIENEKFRNNKKADYIKIWSSRLFLHTENDKNPVTLADAFIMPDCNYYYRIKDDIFIDKADLKSKIENFVNDNGISNTQIIIGVPGMGKTSLAAWMADKYKDDERVIILRFRDWDKKELEDGLLEAIYNTLECRKKDLENKILILDGFDEIKTLHIRKKLLDEFLYDIRDFENLKCLVTSRPDYIKEQYLDNWVEIKQFTIDKVEEFYKIITKKDLEDKENVIPNLDVLGIPVILYMAIMSGVNISENPTKPELYNRIFAEKGGIFDKFYDGKTQYSVGKQVIRNSKNIKVYLKFLCDIAFKMYRRGNLSLQKGEYKIPELEFNGKCVSILEFPVKYLFDRTESSIEFIHKSILEYFAAEFVFTSVRVYMDGPKAELAGFFGSTLKDNRLTNEILEFLKYRIRNSELNRKFHIVKDVFRLMLQDGMTYYTKYSPQTDYKNVIYCETMVLTNMFEILHLWKFDYLQVDDLICSYLKSNTHMYLNLKNIVFKIARNTFEDGKADLKMTIDLSRAYLRKAYLTEADLRGADLTGADLREADLSGADLTGVDLRNVNLTGIKLSGAVLVKAVLRKETLRNMNLSGAVLVHADMKQADLTRADLRGADLREADLRGANLRGADLRGADLRGADLRETNLNGTYLEEVLFDENQIGFLEDNYNLAQTRVCLMTGEIVSYQTYKNGDMLQ